MKNNTGDNIDIGAILEKRDFDRYRREGLDAEYSDKLPEALNSISDLQSFFNDFIAHVSKLSLNPQETNFRNLVLHLLGRKISLDSIIRNPGIDLQKVVANLMHVEFSFELAKCYDKKEFEKQGQDDFVNKLTCYGFAASDFDFSERVEAYHNGLVAMLHYYAGQVKMKNHFNQNGSIITEKKDLFFKNFFGLNFNTKEFNNFYRQLLFLSADDPIVIELVLEIVNKFFEEVKKNHSSNAEKHQKLIISFIDSVLKPCAVGACDKSDSYKRAIVVCERISELYNKLDSKNKLKCDAVYRHSRAILARYPADTAKKVISEEKLRLEKSKDPINPINIAKKDFYREFRLLPINKALETIAIKTQDFSDDDTQQDGDIGLSAKCAKFASLVKNNFQEKGLSLELLEYCLNQIFLSKTRVFLAEADVMPYIFAYSRFAFLLYLKKSKITGANAGLEKKLEEEIRWLKFAADFYPVASLELAKLYNPLNKEGHKKITKDAKRAFEYYVIAYCAAVNENDYPSEKKIAKDQCAKLFSNNKISPEELQKILLIRLTKDNARLFMKDIRANFSETCDQDEFRKIFVSGNLAEIIEKYKTLKKEDRVAVLNNVEIQAVYQDLTSSKHDKEICYEILTTYFKNKQQYAYALLFSIKLAKCFETASAEHQEVINEINILLQEQDDISLPKASADHVKLAQEFNIPELSLAIARTFWKEKNQKDFSQKAQEVLRFALQSDFPKKDVAQNLYFKISLYDFLKEIKGFENVFDDQGDPDFSKLNSPSINFTSLEITNLFEQLANRDIKDELYVFLEKVLLNVFEKSDNLEFVSEFLNSMNSDLRALKVQELFDKIKAQAKPGDLIKLTEIFNDHLPKTIADSKLSDSASDFVCDDLFSEFQLQLAGAINRQDSSEAILNNKKINELLDLLKDRKNLDSQYFICLGDLYRVSDQNNKAMECYLLAASKGGGNPVHELLANARYCKLALYDKEKTADSHIPFFNLIRSVDLIYANPALLLGSFSQEIHKIIHQDFNDAYYEMIEAFDLRQEMQKYNPDQGLDLAEYVEILVRSYFSNLQKERAAFSFDVESQQQESSLNLEDQGLQKKIDSILFQIIEQKKDKTTLLRQLVDSFDVALDPDEKQKNIREFVKYLKSIYNDNARELGIIKIKNKLILNHYNPSQLQDISQSLQTLASQDFVDTNLSDNETVTDVVEPRLSGSDIKLDSDNITLDIINEYKLECEKEIKAIQKEQAGLFKKFKEKFFSRSAAQGVISAEVAIIKNIAEQITNISEIIPVVNEFYKLCDREKELKSEFAILSDILRISELRFKPRGDDNRGKYKKSGALVEKVNALSVQEGVVRKKIKQDFQGLESLEEESPLENSVEKFVTAFNNERFEEIDINLLQNYDFHFKSLLKQAKNPQGKTVRFSLGDEEFLNLALKHITIRAYNQLKDFLRKKEAATPSPKFTLSGNVTILSRKAGSLGQMPERKL